MQYPNSCSAKRQRQIKFCLFRSCLKTCEIVLLACCCGPSGCNFIVYCVDTAKTTITLYIKKPKMIGLETNFESTRPNVETETNSLSARPRPRPRPQKIGLEAYITVTYDYGKQQSFAVLKIKSYVSQNKKLFSGIES